MSAGPRIPASCCLLLLVAFALSASNADEPQVTVRTNFPGGNVNVIKNSGSTLHVAPDLRGDRPWFFWYFEAEASKAGRVEFVLPDKVAGFKDGGIGFQGPAISEDGGETWRWMGIDNVSGSRFVYDFEKARHRVRFAVTIPYVKENLTRFLKRNASSSHLKHRELTKSRAGRTVDVLQIGKPDATRKNVLVTARHHAVETMASYVLEGFLEEAMSNSAAGEEFRKKYALFAVPLVDTDGVEEGDQGKNRKPHDHNRDYGQDSIYPEIQAIKKLDKTHNFQFALDFHCPTLVMRDHQLMYFVGAKTHPQYNFENVAEFSKWIKKGLPKTAPHGPLNWLRDESKPSFKNSHYFGFKKDAIMAATFEFPFAPPGRKTDPSNCRQYGRTMLRAFVNTHFRSPDQQKD